MEEARFSRIQGEMARQQARLAQIQTVSQTGSSLLTMGSFDGFGKQPTPRTNMNQPNAGGRNLY